MIKKAVLYFHTIKYLKAKQIAYRIAHVAKKKYRNKRVAFSNRQQKIKKEPISLNKAINTDYWSRPKKKIHPFKNNTLTFINKTFNIESISIWNDYKQEKLWLYNLHYFDALNAENSDQQKKTYLLLERWIVENPYASGIGWDAYPTSLRIKNIIKYKLSGHHLSEPVTQSLYLQGRYLYQNCEYHLLGNHLFANYIALCFVGLYFDTAESLKWFTKGYRGLKKEIKAQILPDGGHFELSPMYHCLILEDFLDLQQMFKLCQKSGLFIWKNEIEHMLLWLHCMQHPNNTISHFNDSANGVALSSSDLFQYAEAVGYSKSFVVSMYHFLQDSGYDIYHNQCAKLIFDVGAIGPTYLPAHAHADTLSFELSIDAYPIFVNLGTSTYWDAPRRQYERSTGAHNTLVFENKNSSEVWGQFRAARRAHIITHYVSEKDNTMQIEASHDGFGRYKKGVIHTRNILMAQNFVILRDRLNMHFKSAHVFLHLHPSCMIIASRKNEIKIQLPNNKVILVTTDNELAVTDSQYAIEFGSLTETKSLRISLDKVTGDSSITIRWM